MMDDLDINECQFKQSVREDSEEVYYDDEMDMILDTLLCEEGRYAADHADGVDPPAAGIVRLPDNTILSGEKFRRMEAALRSIIETYHEANPLVDGIPRQELISRLRDTWYTEDDKLLQAAIKYLMNNNVLQDKGKSIAVAGFKIEYTEEQRSLREDIRRKYEAAGIEMLRTEDILALGEGGIAAAILEDLAGEGVIVKVNPSYYISASGWEEAVNAARSFDADFTLAEFRDKLGTSRKFAAELLPALDKSGVTVFNGTSRTAVKR